MPFSMRFCIFISIVFSIKGSYHAAELDSYGKYKIVVTNYTMCPGSKVRSNIDVNSTWVKNKDGTDDIFMDATIKSPIGPLGIRMKVYKFIKAYKLTLEYRIKNLCSHFLARDALMYMPKVDSKCYLQKGNVHYEMRDYNQLMHVFFGERFFFGDYQIHSDYTSEREQIVCYKLYMTVVRAS